MQNRSKMLLIIGLLLFFFGVGLIGYGYYQRVDNMSFISQKGDSYYQGSGDMTKFAEQLMLTHPDSPAAIEFAEQAVRQSNKQKQNRLLFFISGGLLCAGGIFCLVISKRDKGA